MVPIDEAKGLVEEIVKNVSSDFDSLLLVSKIKQYDSYTYTHGLNVSIFCVAFGIYLGLSKTTISGLALSGLLHDVGKSFIPLEILNKPGKLTVPEFEIMKLHPIYGAQIVSKSKDLLPEVINVCLEHHEKISGEGYPNRYANERITKPASLVSILDVFDALTSVRSYKNAMPKHKAVSIISSLKGVDFLPSLVDKFLKFIGVYPVGSLVSLRSGSCAIVVRQNRSDSLLPIVKIFRDCSDSILNARDVDLSLAVYSQDPLYDIVGCSGETF
ncbi:HD-GYP domain-containing protein [Solidesulfovibrio sp.]